MPHGFKRTDRLGDQILRELAALIRLELKDPRLGLVTLSGIKVSKDLGYADVYVTVMGQSLDVDPTISLDVLNNAAGFLRSELGRRIKVRVIPRLRFHYDEVLARANHLNELISQAARDDAARATRQDGDETDSDKS